MIKYNLGIECSISFDNFLKFTLKNNDVKYKSDFNSFSELFEFIDKNINDITHLLFDGYEYFLENGKLHNLYGPAFIKYNEDKNAFGNVVDNYYFYIDGKLCYNLNDDRGCKYMRDFTEGDIYHYKSLTNKKKSYIDEMTGKIVKPKKGVDYIYQYINLESRIKIDQRKKKLIQLSK